MAQNGIAVLADGLPPLPAVLTHRMAVPMAYWAAADRAVVLFLCFGRRRHGAIAMRVTFTQQDGQWKADGPHWHGGGFHTPSPTPAACMAWAGKSSPSAAPAKAVMAPSCTAPRPRR